MGMHGPAKCPKCERTELVRVGMGDEGGFQRALTDRIKLLAKEHPDHPAFDESPFCQATYEPTECHNGVGHCQKKKDHEPPHDGYCTYVKVGETLTRGHGPYVWDDSPEVGPEVGPVGS